MTSTRTELPGYTDPHPGKKGSDLIREECGCDNGVYTGPSRITWGIKGKGETTWCFDCGGAGFVMTKVSSIRARVRSQIRRELAAEKEQAEQESRVDAWRQQNVGLAATLDALMKIDDQLAWSFVGHIRKHGNLTDAQAQYLADRVQQHESDEARKAAELAAARPVIEGRITITGEVAAIKEQDSRFSRHGIDVKMLVKDDRGFKVWGTFPRGLDADKGDRVTFTATVVKSDRDECFGFFSRPTKATKV